MWKRFMHGSYGSARTVMVTGLRAFTKRDLFCLCSTVTTSISSSSAGTTKGYEEHQFCKCHGMYISCIAFIVDRITIQLNFTKL